MGVNSSFNVILTHVRQASYRGILTAWQKLYSKNPSTTMDYLHETIWNNRFIRIDDKPVFYSSWYRKGVNKIHHLLNERGTFLWTPDFQKKYGLSVDFLTCNGILVAITHEWKKNRFLIQKFLITVNDTTSSPRTSRPKRLAKCLC